jgi:hypothetical protein
MGNNSCPFFYLGICTPTSFSPVSILLETIHLIGVGEKYYLGIISVIGFFMGLLIEVEIPLKFQGILLFQVNFLKTTLNAGAYFVLNSFRAQIQPFCKV